MNSSIWNLLSRIESNKREIKLDYENPENINANLCKECGGRCCTKCGCHFSPRDFKEISFEYLKREIKMGYISIDWIDGEMILRPGGCYILRVRNEGMPIVDTTYMRSHCILWSKENGCKLEYDKRPSGGRLLVPKKEYDPFTKREEYMCYSKYDIDVCCEEWRRYQEVLAELVRYFRGKDYPCLI